MTKAEFRKALMDIALKNGCTAAETVYVGSEKFSVRVLNNKPESCSVSNVYGMGLRVSIEGHDGYAYTEAFEDPEALVLRASDNARFSESGDERPMQGVCEYVSVPDRQDSVLNLSETEKTDMALRLEELTISQDPRICRVQTCGLTTVRSTMEIHNTQGLSAARNHALSYAVVGAVAEQDGEVHDGYAYRAGDETVNLEACAQEAAQEALAQFGAAPVTPGKMRVLFRNDAAADLLEGFSPIFSAEDAQKGLSLLAGHEGETIAAACVSLVDDPLLVRNPRAFDDEGTPSVRTEIIQNGVFQSLLYNLKTAKKAGIASTSNAGRPSAAAPAGVEPSNMYLLPGSGTLEEMTHMLGNGLLITQISGLHAGLHTVSGDFSLLAKGYLVEDGKTVRPVDKITVAGNFFQMLKDISHVGADLKFGIPACPMIGSPSILVTELMVSGK